MVGTFVFVCLLEVIGVCVRCMGRGFHGEL